MNDLQAFIYKLVNMSLSLPLLVTSEVEFNLFMLVSLLRLLHLKGKTSVTRRVS